MTGMPFYGLLFPSLGIHLFADRTNPGSSSSTPTRSSLVCGVIFIFNWLIFVLYLSLLCHPTHSYLLSPHFDFRLTHQFTTIRSHLIHSIFISPYVYYWVMVCAQDLPLTCMYINIWCLLLAFPRLDINLDFSTTCPLYSNLRVVLVDNSFHLSLICSSCQVFEALRRKPAWQGFAH